MRLDDNFTIKKPHCGLSALTQAVHWDNPILFYIDYYQISYALTPFTLHIKGGYLYTREQIKKYLTDCENWGKYIMNKLPSAGINEKALWLHDVIIANVRYRENGINSHNMIGVIKDGEAVCEGIAKTYKYLCDLANIPCIFVPGLLEQEPHAWNMLWVGGGTSFVDVTNDIRNGGGYERNYFLRSSAEMKGYSWDTSLIPDCKVYNTGNAFFTARNKKEFLNIIRQNASKDSLNINLQFDHYLDDAGINMLMSSCSLLYPPLMTRKVTYSTDRQIIYISK